MSICELESWKMHTLILVIVGCLFSGVLGKYYIATLPNVIRYNNAETVTVSVFELTNAAVEIWLELHGKEFSRRNVNVPNQASPIKTTVIVTEADILSDDLLDEKPRTVKICSKYKGQTDCQVLILSYNTGHLLVQSDKPIYTPNQRVNLRALAFDESLKPMKGETVGIDITSPSNRTLGRRMIKQSNSGFYMHDFELPPHPEVGLWTARAFFKGQYETTGRALFHVKEYVLPTFGVKIEMNEHFILPTTDAFKVVVLAQYVYKKPVNGNARIDLNLRGDGTRELILSSARMPLVSTDNQDSVAIFHILVDDIMNSSVVNNVFPDGSRLEVVATVFEDETGNEENAVHDSTMFTKNPLEFKFTQSKLNFRPGMEYFLKVQVLYANGEPVRNKRFLIKMFDQNNSLEKSRIEPTDSEGRIVEAFPTANIASQLKFKVYSEDEKWKSDFFIVDHYQGKNQIQVEVVKKDGRSSMRAYTNTQGNLYTGLMFMVITRGKVVYTKYIDPGNQRSDDITDALEKAISPSARLIVYYVDKTSNEIVADSVKFSVKRQCQGKELTLKPERSEIKPGARSLLTVNGDPFTYVGLNIMDKALLLLNKENVLKRDAMFEALESHDLGCGEGSGANSADVFKGTGLTVLTNAKITKAALNRDSVDCDAKQRKRRYTDCFNADIKCCLYGVDEADRILYINGYDRRQIDPFLSCYQLAKQVVLRGKAPMICVNAVYLSCKQTIFDALSIPTDLMGRSLGFETEYLSDLEKITAAGGQVRTRSDFRESWQFTVMDLDKNGEKRMYLGYPDSITEWMIQAVGISNEGLCIAHPKNVTTFRDFFIQLELPYKAIRLEPLNVKVTIFNYGRDPKTANVYLKGHEGLCYDAESGKNSRRTRIVVEPNSAKTIRFPMVPMKKGRFSIVASAIVYDNGVAENDEVKKYLLVENEGIEEQINVEICLDPLKQSEDCVQPRRVISEVIREDKGEGTQVVTVDLSLPKDSIPTTGSATGYLQGNLMDNVVRTLLQGVESLFTKPAGCGEQTMIRLSPCVSAMTYLKQTKQMTDQIEKIGNEYIRHGVSAEVSQYRHHDGAYSAWRHRPASTWLTAFVAKVFCQAKRVVDDAVDEEKDIALTINWLASHAEPDGSFIDRNPVIHREMVGQVKDRNQKDPSLTAFVLVALQECNIRTRALNATIQRAMQYLENLDRHMLRQNPYILALSTYALALSKSTKRREFLKLLMESKKGSNREGAYWGNAGGYPASANSVETTAYALLSAMQFHDMRTSGKIVTWLTSQRDSRGSFRTTQDTVIGLQALSEYSLKTYNKDLDLRVTLLADEWDNVQQFSVTSENSIAQKVIKKLPVESKDNLLIVEVSGKGTGRMTIDLRYNRPAKYNEGCGFNVTDVAISDVNELDINIRGLGNCDVCGKCGEEVPPPFYDDLVFGEEVIEAEPRIESNIGRKKRSRRGKRVSSELKCARFSVSTSEGKTGMTMVNFGLETGVEVVKSDLEKLVAETENIDTYEYDNNGFVAFYLSEATTSPTDFVFRLKDTFDDKGGERARQPSSLTVYDYYDPDKSCSKMYRAIGESFSFECDQSSKKQCQCLRNLCVKPKTNTLIEMAKKGQRPAVKLLDYTCNPSKANYAVLVNITKLSYDPSANQKIISAKVLKSLHKGVENIRNNDEMTFFMSLNCREPALSVGSKYVVIGKDGIKGRGSEGQSEYKYPLMGSTLVFEKKPKTLLAKILRSYEQLAGIRGCAV